jgi:hypothetical protein
MEFGRYRKFVVATAGAVVALIPILWPGNSTAQQILSILIAFGTAFGVLGVANDPLPGATAGEPLHVEVER